MFLKFLLLIKTNLYFFARDRNGNIRLVFIQDQEIQTKSSPIDSVGILPRLLPLQKKKKKSNNNKNKKE